MAAHDQLAILREQLRNELRTEIRNELRNETAAAAAAIRGSIPWTGLFLKERVEYDCAEMTPGVDRSVAASLP